MKTILEVQGLPTAPVTYGLSEGNNLISYDHAYGKIENAFPVDAVSSMNAVYGQGVMAAVVDGEFLGSLSSIDAGESGLLQMNHLYLNTIHQVYLISWWCCSCNWRVIFWKYYKSIFLLYWKRNDGRLWSQSWWLGCCIQWRCCCRCKTI